MIVGGWLLHVCVFCCVCCCTCVRVAHVMFFVSRVVFVVTRVGFVFTRAIDACAICIHDGCMEASNNCVLMCLCTCALVWSVVVLCVLG